MSAAHRFTIGLAAVAALAACSGRSPYWDSSVDTSKAPYGLANGVVIIDDPNHQALVLTSTAAHTLQSARLPIGHNFVSAVATPDGQNLLLLSSGDWPLKNATDDPPSLTLLKLGSDLKATTTRFDMSEPLSNLVVDPEGTYAVAYQGSAGSQSFATNPNEIVIFDLTPGHTRQIARTLRSFGGTPQRLTFSAQLNLPAQSVMATPRRLLVVETDIDVTIVDLSHAFKQNADMHPGPTPDITLRLTEGTSTTPVTPAGLAIDPNPDDGFIALRTTASNNVFTFQLVAAPTPASTTEPFNDFTANPNLTDVGGVASDIQFVNTSDGLRVAALVPSTSQAVLFEPVSSAKTLVNLPSPYSKLSLVTQAVTGTTGSTGKPPDVAMLWTATQNAGPATGVALWTLDTAVQGAPYRSIEVLSVDDPIASVMDVPNSPNGALKILTTPESSTHAFYVLDLVRRTPSPLDTKGTPSLSLSPDGERVWAYLGGGTDLASITLDTLNPTPLTTGAPISAVFDIAAQGYDAKMGTGPRTLVAIHAQGTFGATLFDAIKPTTATANRSVGLLLEGP